MAERDVVYVLKVQPHDENEATLRRFGTEASKVYDRIKERAQTAFQQQAQHVDRTIARTTKLMQQQGTAGQQATRQVASGSERAAQAQEKLAAEVTRSREQIQQANLAMNDSFRGVLENTVKMGRGFAALGLVGEENLQKVLDTLLLMQGASDLIGGGLEIYKNLVNWVRAYEAATKSATTAQLALAAATATTGRAAVGGAAAGGAASSVAAGAIGGGLTAKIGGVLAGGGAAAAGTAAIIGLGIGGLGFTAADQALGTGYGRRAAERTGLFGEGSTLGRYLSFGALGREENRRAGIGGGLLGQRQMDAALAELLAGTAQLQLQTGGDVEQQMRQAQSVLSDLLEKSRTLEEMRRGGAITTEQEFAVQQQILATREQMADLEDERANERRRANAEAVAAAQQTLRLAEQERDIAKAIADQKTRAYEGDVERFAGLDPLQQNRLRDIRRQVDAGERLSAQDAALAAQFSEFSEAARAANIARGIEAGAEDIFRAGRAGAEAATSAAATVERAVIEARTKVDVTIERNDDEEAKLAQAITQAVQASLTQRDRVRDQQIERMRQQFAERDAATRNAVR